MQGSQYIRYKRHLSLPEIGITGQEKILNARVLLIGAGGLGSPILIYLAAAGIGTIGIMESDIVDLSNLQRQIIYETDNTGCKKIKIASDRIKKLNPDIQVIEYDEPLTANNIFSIFKSYDYIIDATDNFETRFLINDACILLRKKYVFGSIYKFEGQVTIYGAENGPCYRCLFPSISDIENYPTSVDLGVFGVLPGIIGTLQATEVVKLICSIGKPLIGRLLQYDALSMRFKEFRINKNPNCPICGNNPTIHSVNMEKEKGEYD